MLAWAPRGLASELEARTCAWATLAFALTGVAALAFAPGGASERLLLALLVQAAAALAAFDLRFRLIPDLYTLALGAAGIAGPLAPGLAASVVGAAVGGGLLAAARWIVGRRLRREAMGLGDVKLAAALGVLLGPTPLLWTTTIAAALGAAAGLLMLRRTREPLVPLGALLAPVGVAVLWMGRLA